MNLISCESCSIVIDKTRIEIEKDALNLEYEDPIYKKFFAWDNEVGEWLLFIKCPCCKTDIFFKNGDIVL